MTIKIKAAIAVAAAVLLSACGGGGSDGGSGSSTTPTTSTAAIAEGVWNGTTSPAGYTLSVLVLENGDFYNMFGTVSAGVLQIVGFDQGGGTMVGNAFSGTVNDYLSNGTHNTGSVTATVATGVSLNGNTAYSSGGNASFTTTPTPLSSYSYNTGAAIADISGSWSGSMLNGTSAALTINSSGNIAGTNGGCSYSGTATPRASGKNVFDVAITFGATPCTISNQTVSGIAIDYMLTSGAKQFLIALQDSSKTNGTMFIAQR